MIFDVSEYYTPFAMNISSSPTGVLPVSNGFKWVTTPLSVADILEDLLIPNCTLTYTHHLYQMVINHIQDHVFSTRAELAKAILKQLPEEEQTMEQLKDIFAMLVSSEDAGSFIMVDNTPNLELNRLINLWCRQAGFKIIYPTYTYEAHFSDLVAKQYLANSQATLENSFIC